MNIYQHQQDGIDFIIKNNGVGALYFDCGLGKTATTIIIKRKLGGRCLVFCPLTLITNAWIEDIQKFAPEMTYQNLHDDYKKIRQVDFYLANYEMAVRKEKLEAIMQCQPDMVVLDECFSGDTLIDTPSGKVKIKNLKENDIIINCTGQDTVLAQRIKTLDDFVIITYNGKKIKCSLNHKFFTTNGWKNAESIKRGDTLVSTEYSFEILSGMQEDILSVHKIRELDGTENIAIRKKQSFLREILLGEMENATTSGAGSGFQQGCCKKNFGKLVNEVCNKRQRCKTAQKESKKTCEKFNEKSSLEKQDAENNYTNEVEADCSRRKRKSNANPAKNSIKESREWMVCRIRSFFRNTKSWISNMLQDRHCKPEEKNRCGSKWNEPSFSKIIGHKKEKKTKFIRVENIKVYKQGRVKSLRKNNSENTFYDLTIKNHPSFSVNGVLVHNSQKVKSHQTQTTKNLLSIRNSAKYKILLSGTPAPNDESEYWAQMRFLNDSIFPASFYQFRNYYFHLKRGKQVVEIPNGSFITKDMSRKMFSQGFKYDILPEKRTALLERMRPYVMFKKLHECVDLPESTEIIRKFTLPPEQYKTYKAMRDDLVAEIKGQYIAAPLALTKISKLRQISSGFLIDSEGKCVDMEKNAKLDELKELLAEIGNEQVIIWTWFVHEAMMIKAALGDKARIINGTTDENDKNDFIRQFKSGSVQYLIANPQSVAFGITLTNAHYAIYYSLSYSHEQHYQSVHRIMRISQKNQCFYYYLLADKTIDEIIFDVLKRKAGEEEIIKEMLR